MNIHPKFSSDSTTLILLLFFSTVPNILNIKIILMYAPCDDQLTYILQLLHKSIKPHFTKYDVDHDHVDDFKRREVFHARHDLSDACMWVLQETVAVIAISDDTNKWEGIDDSAHSYNLPHFVSPNLCQCNSNSASELFHYNEYLDTAVFEFLKATFLHYVIIMHEEEHSCGILLGNLLTSNNIRVSHLRVTENRLHFLKTLERFFDAWNMMDLSDEGRLLISLGGGSIADSLLKTLVESNMHNKRTKLLVFGSPKIWQKRLKNLIAYEVDLVVVSSDPLPLDDCPAAIELLPLESHSHKVEGLCANLSSEYKTLGEAILRDFQNDFSKSCCPRSEMQEMYFTFWQSEPYENGTQLLKPQAMWSDRFGLMRMMPIDLEIITLRIAVLPYYPYVQLNTTGSKVTLKDCVFKRVIEFLCKRLNFKYKLVMPTDNEWGNKIGLRKFNGAIGMVTRGEADMIPYLTSTPSRREVIDYSKPLSYVKYSMLVAIPQEPPRAFIFLRPFKSEVWFLLVISSLVVSFILCKIHGWSCKINKGNKKYGNGLSTFFSCFWLIFGAVLNQGGVHLPVTNSARLVLASWWLAVLVIMATFSANLIAFLAFPETRWVVKNLEDLLRHKTIQVTVRQASPILENFMESNIEIFQQIREAILSNPKRGILLNSTVDDLEERIADGKTVFIDDLNVLNKMLEDDYNNVNRCRLTISPEKFSTMDLALGFRRGSSFLSLVNKEIQQMQESGVLSHWKSEISPQRDECLNLNSNIHGQSEIKLEDLQGPFYLLAIGLVFALIFLSWEYIWNKAKAIYKQFIKRKGLKNGLKRHTSTMYW